MRIEVYMGELDQTGDAAQAQLGGAYAVQGNVHFSTLTAFIYLYEIKFQYITQIIIKHDL